MTTPNPAAPQSSAPGQPDQFVVLLRPARRGEDVLPVGAVLRLPAASAAGLIAAGAARPATPTDCAVAGVTATGDTP